MDSTDTDSMSMVRPAVYCLFIENRVTELVSGVRLLFGASHTLQVQVMSCHRSLTLESGIIPFHLGNMALMF